MARNNIIYAPTVNNFNTTLNGAISSSATTIALNSVTGLQNKAGILVIDRVDSSGNLTPSSEEWIYFNGVSGSSVTLPSAADGRGVGGSTAQAHADGAIVEAVFDVTIWGGMTTTYTAEHTDAGLHTAFVSDSLALSSNASISGKLFINSGLIALSAATITNPTLIGSFDGWVSANETWTYASATTITVSSGAASKYAVGDRIKLTQTTVKYFVVVAVADTLLTVTGGTDYTVANAAISANFYSHSATPIGYPQYFNYTPTFGGFSSNPTSIVCTFSIIGRLFTMHYKNTVGTGTSNATNFTVSTPVALLTGSVGGTLGIAENNSVREGPGAIDPGAGNTTVTLYRNGALLAWTGSGTKGAEALFIEGEVA